MSFNLAQAGSRETARKVYNLFGETTWGKYCVRKNKMHFSFQRSFDLQNIAVQSQVIVESEPSKTASALATSFGKSDNTIIIDLNQIEK
jgi:hypothetical protein